MSEARPLDAYIGNVTVICETIPNLTRLLGGAHGKGSVFCG
ncbi:Hypothetical protein RG1141_CH11580 [Neorhizobium galegae bv. officinalis bv. officinalis str. HAMBI 1141]|uniref:Uncharacterized protein n=1 Tax=Neorhizobium galegae bv. officinalis bv. officinalis str. HAMBI 1141 TaxID=1028801 RepID=A0A068T639_NEOGA|nr:Hypothetical protein RG1141_CH11580 [Neorhizobium galegae bv. officinalis bv. officinalis str. HAMBI 1141]